MKTTTNLPPVSSECEVLMHSERGESSVEVRHEPSGRTIAEWSGDDLASMIEDGFFEGGAFWGYDGPRIGRREFVSSVIGYCQGAGLIA